MHLSKEEEKIEYWTLTAFTFYFFKKQFWYLHLKSTSSQLCNIHLDSY